ncbi:MAG TPA: DUF1236 domain-containing protein [Beijerinckiaceae bacterium]|jgi:hypothetical protein
MRAALLLTVALAALSLTLAGTLNQSHAQSGSSGARPSTSAPSAGGSAASTGGAGGTSGTGGSSSQGGTGGSAAGTSGISPSGPSGSSGTGGSSSAVGSGGSAAGTAGQSAVTPPGANGASPATTGALSAGALTTQQRVELRRNFTILNTAPARNLPVPVTAGTVIPEGVTLHEVPADAVKAAPSLNGQRFFVIRNDVVIVDPATRKIVTVLEGNS